MAAINFKNKLQEHCQKHKLPLPKYRSKIVGGSDHQPIWISVVECTWNDKKFRGTEDATKTLAEHSAAEQVLIDIEQELKSKIVDFDHNIGKKKTVMIIDIENMPKFPDLLTNDIYQLIDVFAIIGQYHHAVDKELNPKINKLISPSSRSNGSDTYIQVLTGSLLTRNYYELYIFVSRDTFVHSLAEMVEHRSEFWMPKKAQVIVSIDQLKKIDLVI